MTLDAEPRERACPFDHHSEEFASDYLGEYARLRPVGPVIWTDAHGGYWVATTYAAVRAALLDADTFVTSPSADGMSGGLRIPRPDRAKLRPLMIPGETSGKEHDDARLALNKHFNAKRVAELQPMIDRHVASAMQRVIAAGEFDVIFDLASPVIAGVVDEYLGLGSEDPPNFFRTIAAMVAGDPGALRDPQIMQRYERAWQYVVDMIEDRMANPSDDVISYLASEVNPGFTVPEIQSMTLNVLIGGSETAGNLTAHSMTRLAADQELRAFLRADPAAIPRFLEEVLRISDIVMGIARTVTRDLDFFGVELRVGDRILLPLAAANHDPARFANPDAFDIVRGANGHVAMGAGMHFCLGANLGKAIVTSILTQLLADAPEFVLTEGAERNENKATSNVFHRVPARFLP